MVSALSSLIAAELAQPVDPRVREAAAAIAAQHPGARAVIFYGSVLRTGQIDGQMLDFYLIVRDYREAYARRWLALANRLVPPNVFPFERNGVAAKYAVLSEADLMRLAGPEAGTVSVWARFAQPVRLAWAADESAQALVVQAVARSCETLLSLAPPCEEVLDRWRRGFELTYSAELRAERGDRPGSIVDWDPTRYQRIGDAVFSCHSRESGNPPSVAFGCGGERRISAFAGMTEQGLGRKWRRLRRTGKLMTLVRLAKASLTFAGGVDYLAWKINRHAGAGIVVQPWQRRWPLLGALILLPRLLRKGAVR
jgi:hypothetical protein